jgi:hypothetical protein
LRITASQVAQEGEQRLLLSGDDGGRSCVGHAGTLSVSRLSVRRWLSVPPHSLIPWIWKRTAPS